jgi:hypothetical protein
MKFTAKSSFQKTPGREYTLSRSVDMAMMNSKPFWQLLSMPVHPARIQPA